MGAESLPFPNHSEWSANGKEARFYVPGYLDVEGKRFASEKPVYTSLSYTKSLYRAVR